MGGDAAGHRKRLGSRADWRGGVRSSRGCGWGHASKLAPLSLRVCVEMNSPPQTWEVGVAEDCCPLERKEGSWFQYPACQCWLFYDFISIKQFGD